MEKLFWGMVGGCTVAFGILLCIYLNKIGVIGAQPETSTETVTEIESETGSENETETETGSDLELAEGEFPADIRSMIQDSQENYAPAMKVFEEESAQAASREAAEIKQSQSSAASSAGSDRKTNGGVDGNRNDNHEYFLEEPTDRFSWWLQ